MLRGIAYGILSRLMEHLIYMQGGRDMSEINWSCCSLVAQNPLTRAFIEQLAKERKARVPSRITAVTSTIFCLPFQSFPSQNCSKRMKAELLTMWIGCGSARRNEDMGTSQTEARSRTPLDRNLHLQPSGGMSARYAVFTGGVSGFAIAKIPSIRFAKGYADRSEVLSLCQPRSLGFQTNANGKPFCNMSSRSSR